MSTAIIRIDTDTDTLPAITGPAFDTTILAGQKSPNTIEQYRLHWLAYVAYAGSWGEAVQPATLARWRQRLFADGYTLKDGTHRPYTVNAINLRLASVRSVMAAAAEAGYIDRGTAEAFKAVRGLKLKANKERRKDHARTLITRDDMDNICNAPSRTTGAGLMHRALLLTMRYTGARITDVVTMKITDVTELATTDRAGKTTKAYLAQFMGKNESEPVQVEIGEPAKLAIDTWLTWRKLRGIESEYIFTGFTGRGDRGPSGKPISRVSAWELVTHYAAKVNLEHIKPHDFRRYVGTQLAAKDIRLAQKQLRHKRLETTAQHYVLDGVLTGHMDAL